MSALLCCGACFDTQNLGEDGNIYCWLDLLLTSSDDKVKSIIKCHKYGNEKSLFSSLPTLKINIDLSTW